MKPTIIATLFAVALTLVAAAAGADGTTGPNSASSVADMVQSKHDSALRAQFVREGRWDEIGKLDAAKTQRSHAKRDQVYLHMNEQIAHGTSVQGPPIDTRALECDADSTHVR